MQKHLDQLNNSILLSNVPKRIVSLVPSITELLVDLGLEENIVGITKFCEEPIYLKSKCQIIGGTKNVNILKIKSLNPEIVIANKEENIKEDINIIQNFTNVWISDVKNIKDNIDLIEKLGKLFDKEIRSKEIIFKINNIIHSLPLYKQKHNKVLYLIWKKPYMTVGKDTFISSIINMLGFENIITDIRYPIADLEKYKNADFVFLSSEPYPFSEKDKTELQSIFEKSKIFFVDGSYFSWYGSRFLKSIDYFKFLITNLD
jgi:iron complex transport system substrate-binding protein